MAKKNVVEGNISHSGTIHIGDKITNIFAEGIENIVEISKAHYRKVAKQKQFELPEFYIQRSLTHLKAILESQKYYYPAKEFRPLRDLLSEKQKMVLLGDAGMGKSTELKYLYNDLLVSCDDVFPVWVSLSNHLLSESFEVYLSELANIDNAKIVLIMDGYDEIPSSDHPQLNRLIANLLSKRNQINILYSSRKNTYDINTTLEGFEIYYLNEVELIDIQRYFSCLGDALQYCDFEQELNRVKLVDIIKIPFYLDTLVKLFLSEQSLPESRSKLMQHCIESMVLWDRKRYNTVLPFDRYEVTKVIKKVALAMEMLCRNVISETDLRQILDKNEFDDLKYFGGFKKEDGTNESWKFDHNNFQEYLAASAISHLSFDKILEIISFEPDYTVLNPSWLNTISYLLSEIDSKDTFDKLLLWLKTHNSHFLVNAESTRIHENIRFDVFKRIFHEFEKNDTFLYSNHFTDEKLVAFVQDIDDIFIFLLEKYTSSNNIKVKINALRLLGHIDYTKNYGDYQVLYDVLFEGINNHRILINGVLLHNMIECLGQTKMLKEGQIEDIVGIINEVQSYEVINSGVKIIIQSGFVDKYVNYLVKAFQYNPTDKIFDIGLNYYLGEAFSKIHLKEGIITLLNHLNEIDWHYENKMSLTFFSKVMENAHRVFKEDETILFEILKTINNPNLQESHYYQISLLHFFNNTQKRDLAFVELLRINKLDNIKNVRILALLVSEKTVKYLLDDINSEQSEIDWIFHINVSHNDIKDKVFTRIISNKTINDGKFIEFLIDEKKFKQNSFNLLFDPDGFKAAVDIFIKNFENEKITKDDDNKLINENFNGKIRFKTPDCVISLLQILIRQYNEISISQFRDLINDEEKIRCYRITMIRELIYNNDTLEIKIEQIEYLNSWVLDILSRHKFASLNIDIKYCIVDFSVRFDFDLPHEVLTQLLAFESYVKGKDTCFNWLKTKMNKKHLVTNITRLLNSDHTHSERVLLNSDLQVLREMNCVCFVNYLHIGSWVNDVHVC